MAKRWWGCLLWLCAVTAWADVPSVAAESQPAMVVVGSFQRTRSPAFIPLGSGFAVADGRLIATNAHVKVRSLDTERMESLAILLPGANPQNATVREVERVAVDEAHDLALLRLKAGAALPALSLDETRPVLGQSIVLIGFPLSSALGFVPALQGGLISAIAPISLPAARADKLDAAVIRQTMAGSYPIYVLDAVARPGNSGSPVLDVKTGKVLGVVSAGMIRQTREAGLAEPTGITYAIPAEHLQRLLKTLP